MGGGGGEFLHPLNYHTHMLAHVSFVFAQDAARLLFFGRHIENRDESFKHGSTLRQRQLTHLTAPDLMSVLKFDSLSLCSPSQASLNKLMETLGQSEPYFVKCIRSNAEKVELLPADRTFNLILALFLSLFIIFISSAVAPPVSSCRPPTCCFRSHSCL